MKRILFVDDEPSVLSGLERMLRPMRAAWELHFAEGGQSALSKLADQSMDIVVSDMRMPGMDGVQFLDEVRRRHPEAVRIILSGHADQELILRSVGPTHQFLSKPCDPDLLKRTIDRACILRDRLSAPRLKQLVAQVGALPSLPTLYSEILSEISSPKGSLESVGRIIAKDMGMTAKVLQIVNSAFFGIRKQISNPAEAAKFLGMETIKALVLSVQIFSKFECDRPSLPSLSRLWSASMRVGGFSRLIARELGLGREQVDQAFFAGTLHDIGILVLVSRAPDEYEEVVRLAGPTGELKLVEAEAQVLGSSHGEIGAYLLGIWGLPGTIVETVAFHHHPSRLDSAVAGPLTCVHIGDAIAAGLESGDLQDEARALDAPYVAALELGGRLADWREKCRAASEEAQP